MATTTIKDDAIWVKHIEAGSELRARITGLRAGETIDLEVDGIVGRWERMRDGRDGRPTLGVRPVAEMREVWKRLQSQRGRIVGIREVLAADTYLAALAPMLSEWDSPADNEAYRDL